MDNFNFIFNFNFYYRHLVQCYAMQRPGHAMPCYLLGYVVCCVQLKQGESKCAIWRRDASRDRVKGQGSEEMVRVHLKKGGSWGYISK